MRGRERKLNECTIKNAEHFQFIILIIYRIELTVDYLRTLLSLGEKIQY